MTANKTLATAALLGGVLWLGSGLLALMSLPMVSGVLLWTGTAVLVVALAAGGYTLVATAPAWLRLVVSLALPALVVVVWPLLVQAAGSSAGSAVSTVPGGLLGVVVGGMARRRAATRTPQAARPTGQHAAR